MNLKQISLKSFFKSKKVSESQSDSESDDQSEYVPSKQKSMFAQPMSWTRVKEVTAAEN